MTKISALSDIGTSVASNDTFVLVDVSDPTTPNKKIQQQNLFLIPDGSAGTPGLRFLNDTNTGIYRVGSDSLAISTNGTGRLFVDASGNVGVGRAPNALDNGGVGQAFQFPSAAIQNYDNGSGNYQLWLLNNAYRDSGGTFRYSKTGTASYYQFDPSGNHVWQNAASGSAGAAVSFAERMRLDSGGRLGLGTSSPNYQLHVTTDFAVGASGFNQQLTFGNDTIQSLLLGTGYTPLKLNPLGGNVGIGVTAPSELLHVNGNAIVEDRLLLQRLQSSDNLSVLTFSDTLSGSKGNNLSLGNPGGFDLLFHTGGVEKARIDSSGRLLVGTSSTSAEVTALLQGNSTSSTFTSVLALCRGSAPNADGAPIGRINFSDNGHVGSGRIEAVRDGGTWTSGSSQPTRLMFSTTADGASSPTERMRISSFGTFYTFLTGNLGNYLATSVAAGTTGTVLRVAHSATQNSVDGTVSFQVFSNGNVENTNNSYAGISDIKLKENIVDASSQWDDLKALQVRNYNFKEETGHQTHTQIGLIAQEAELVSPGLVSESPDRDEEGNDLGTVTKSVNYSVLYMKAVKALQEAMERIEQLETEMAAVKAQLS